MMCAAAGKHSVDATALAAFASHRAVEAFRCLLWILAVLQHHECGVHWGPEKPCFILLYCLLRDGAVLPPGQASLLLQRRKV